MASYEERVKLLKLESERLMEYLSALQDDGWTRQSACERWQVGDVVAHLVGVAEFYAGTVSRGRQGNSSPPEGLPPAGTSNAPASAENIAQRSISARQRMGDHLMATFAEEDNRLNNILADLGPEEREKPCYHPGGIVPAGNFVDLRFKEVALHSWDIRSVLDTDVHLSPESLPSIITLISNSLASGSLPWAFWPGLRASGPVRYRFEVTDPVQYKADVVVEDDEARLEEPSARSPSVTFRCDTETYVLLMYGRLGAAQAITGGRLTVEGDGELAAQFSQWFKGI